MTSRILASAADRVRTDPIPSAQVVSGAPLAGVVACPTAELSCGIWEHTPGTSTDIEEDEVFVVLSGSARIDVEGADTLLIGPGDVVALAAGARTTWHVAETLRKFWVAGR